MNRTKVEWVKNPDGTQGYTWNPITGCLNGCEYCYARKLANGRLKQRYLANYDLAPNFTVLVNEEIYNDPFYPRFWVNRAREEFGSCYAGAKPKGIFVCDMSDLFGIGVPEEWTRRILNKIGMSYYREHRFYLLTKQPQNLARFSPFPDNCWVGVTATDYKMLLQALDRLQYIKASVRYISLEPLLDFTMGKYDLSLEFLLKDAGISWVILGAQTKPYKPPKIEWVEEIVRACDKAGIPVFLKDNLFPLIHEERTVADRKLFGRDNALRQEMPCQKPQ